MKNQKYLIQRPTAIDNSVTVWSAQHVPFEPKDWRLAMRSEMKQAIREIRPESRGLYAMYLSASELFCDVENILFYNIGTSAFKVLSENGMCFERGFDAPPSADMPIPGMNHYYHYASGDEFQLWQKQSVLAAWENTVLPAPASGSKPHLFWYALKSGNINTKIGKSFL